MSPRDAQEAVDKAKDEFEKQGLTAFAPTPFAERQRGRDC